ncbi:MAG: LutC/YkgG family protein [Rubripirellula sp.]
MDSIEKHQSEIAATVGSRRAIMDRLRSRVVDGPQLPTVDTTQLTSFDEPLETFMTILRSVGGEPHLIGRPAEGHAILEEIQVFRDAKRVASLVPELTAGNVDVSVIDDPHALSTLDWAIVPGDFMVAENGSIWIDGGNLPHRVMIFIAQYLAIVVPKKQIVHHMHQAYARIGKPPQPFGVFVSGPSKTADIEQSLVLGAHGCRTLQVFLTD